MCGIAGIVAAGSDRYRDAVAHMIEAMHHRGPDGNGIKVIDNCVLGHSRLAIIDIEAGQQPMAGYDHTRYLSFNGEVYGYKQIRESLSDYPFRTNSDTEIILALHYKYGEWTPVHLPGMFAFAIWDENEQSLFCARDRFGEKPFYYAFGPNGEFIFASEIKAILRSGIVKPVVDKCSLTHYLQKLYVPPTRSIFANIRPLPPGCYLIWKDGKLRIERYWTLPSMDTRIGLRDAVERFKELLQRAIAHQLIADVEVGAFLSGGLDSSTIVAIASSLHSRLKTFSFGFEGEKSELKFAHEIAAKYNTEHIELFANDFNVAELIVKMQGVYDEPFADSSNIPTYLISNLARRHVKVVLTGDGGDELFAGYTYWYRDLLNLEKAYRTNGFLLLVLRILNILLRNRNAYLRKTAEAAANARNYGSVVDCHAAQVSFFKTKEMEDLTGWDHHLHLAEDNSLEKGTFDDALRMDINEYLSGDILVKVDRASMANSLEVRTPFLDKDFASFCISLPASLKISSTEEKMILRRAYEHMWTETIRGRKKQGFGAAVDRWLKHPDMISLKKQYVENDKSALYDLISYDGAKKYFDKDNHQTWSLLVLALWANRDHL